MLQKRFFSQERLAAIRLSKGKCPACEATLPSGSFFCPGCGREVGRKCPVCQGFTRVRDKYCSQCGGPLALPTRSA
ncbi:MAG: hypothetical protein GXX08_03955 [Firmicutes bacterium]|nr:hypothetical protein [Bacillota bacterium]